MEHHLWVVQTKDLAWPHDKPGTVLDTAYSSSIQSSVQPRHTLVELVRNLVAHGDAREGKWRGNWRMEWVANTLTPPPNVVYPALLKLMRTPRLSAVDWTDAPTDLNGLARFGERRNVVSARVPSRSARAILNTSTQHEINSLRLHSAADREMLVRFSVSVIDVSVL